MTVGGEARAINFRQIVCQARQKAVTPASFGIFEINLLTESLYQKFL
jgi:hypothetical protein